VPSKLRERCSGSYLMFAASAGSFFTKSVSSRSWISRATGALVEACRRHGRVEVCEMAVFCVRRRRKKEAVTSCRAMLEVRLCGWTRRGCASLDRFTWSWYAAHLDLDFRGAGVLRPNRADVCCSLGQSQGGCQRDTRERLSECIINCQSTKHPSPFDLV
jgi:hypothetical protein